MTQLIDELLQGVDYIDNQQEEFDSEELLVKYLKRGRTKEHQKLLEEYEQDAEITGSNGLRKKLGAIDLEYFGRAYFPHYFVRKSPEFHRDLDEIWEEGVLKDKSLLDDDTPKELAQMKGRKRAIAAPRGHAKSTTFTFKDSLHAILYQYKHYILILSDSSDQAEGFLGDIKIELEENQFVKEDFGELQGKVWREGEIVTSTNIKVEGIGSGKKVRGRRHRNWRPDLIVLDDIENDENVRTPEQRKKLSNWFFKAVSKAGDSYTDIMYVGTILHYDSLLANILENPGWKSIKYKAVISFAKNQSLWDTWENIFTDLSNDEREEDALYFFEEFQEEMLEGTKVLWQEKNSYYNLMVDRLTEGEASFNSELQNEPIDPDDALFNEEWFDYYNEAEINFRDSRFIFVGFVDPSLGKTKKSDYSTIIILAKDILTGYIYVVEASIERRHPDVIITDIFEKEKWLRREFGRGLTKFGVETNQFQWFLKEELAKRSAKENLYLPIEEINQNSDKEMRIQTLQPYIKNKYIKFNKQHKTLLEQLKFFPMASHDDGPDSLEGATKLAIEIGSGDKEYESVSKRRFGKLLENLGRGAY
jgi:predicted phage terminase large subunit-like protein